MCILPSLFVPMSSYCVDIQREVPNYYFYLLYKIKHMFYFFVYVMVGFTQTWKLEPVAVIATIFDFRFNSDFVFFFCSHTTGFVFLWEQSFTGYKPSLAKDNHVKGLDRNFPKRMKGANLKTRRCHFSPHEKEWGSAFICKPMC